MEESRCKSRVVIQDPIFDQIQEQRHKRHAEAIERLRSFDKKSNSHYLITPNRTGSLDRAKRAKA
jgi:hypothetical protein